MRCSGRSLASWFLVRFHCWPPDGRFGARCSARVAIERSCRPIGDERLRCAISRTKTPLSSCVDARRVTSCLVPRTLPVVVVTVVFERKCILGGEG